MSIDMNACTIHVVGHERGGAVRQLHRRAVTVIIF